MFIGVFYRWPFPISSSGLSILQKINWLNEILLIWGEFQDFSIKEKSYCCWSLWRTTKIWQHTAPITGTKVKCSRSDWIFNLEWMDQLYLFLILKSPGKKNGLCWLFVSIVPVIVPFIGVACLESWTQSSPGLPNTQCPYHNKFSSLPTADLLLCTGVNFNILISFNIVTDSIHRVNIEFSFLVSRIRWARSLTYLCPTDLFSIICLLQ